MTYRLILSIPADASVDALTDAQRAAIGTVRGRWLRMPGTVPASGRVLDDALTDHLVDREMLDRLGLWDWLIVGCWAWDGAAPTVTTVEFLDELLYRPHLPPPVDAAGQPTGAPPALYEPHTWFDWPPCVEAAP
ncbi:hypothetical protein [Plasticicumulans sp.]|uniref:hypothetical protein n=1 Tax=Plasticicumulans sp. TaxID=2307179 RepID=UPI00321FFEE3